MQGSSDFRKKLMQVYFLLLKSIWEFLRTTLNHYQNLFSIIPYRFCLFGEFAEVFKSKIGRAQVAKFHITGMADPGGGPPHFKPLQVTSTNELTLT